MRQKRSTPAFRLYFERPLTLCGGHPCLCWLAVGFLLAAICTALYIWTGQPRYLTTCIPLVLASMVVPAVIRMAYDDLIELIEQALTFVDATPAQVKTWFSEELKVFTPGWRMHGFALLWFTLAAAGYASTDAFAAFESSGYWFAVCLAGLAGFFSGAALFHLFLLGRLIFRLGAFGVRVEPYGCGLLSVGSFMFKYWIIAVFIWLTYLCSWITTSGVSLLLFAIGLPTSIFIVGSFVWSMFPLHRQMVRFKQHEISRIKGLLQGLFANGYDKLSIEQRESVKFMEERAARIDALPEWPFRPRALVGVSLSSLLTLAPSMIKLVAVPSFT